MPARVWGCSAKAGCAWSFTSFCKLLLFKETTTFEVQQDIQEEMRHTAVKLLKRQIRFSMVLSTGDQM